MHDVLTIGSALIDIFIQSDQFELRSENNHLLLCQDYGNKVEVDAFHVLTGGGGGNTAVGCARAGFNAAVVCETGKDTLAQIILQDFHRETVSTNYVVQEKKEQTGGSVILVGDDGGRSVLVHRGAASQLDPTDIPQDAVTRVNWVHLSSIGGRLATLQTIAAARHAVGHLSWNPGSQEMELIRTQQLQPSDLGCEVLLLNKDEWENLAAVAQMLEVQVPTIVVTDGAKGGQVFTQATGWQPYTAEPEQAVDETGAGDAFAVGFVAARLHNLPVATACLWGRQNAGSVVRHFGAKTGLLTYNHLSQL
ncbi:MAG: hypothetical protein A3A82_03980 [Candidatus Pacebacteria bacterium RIFCSPLOWO2_01_FULL_47_12]|nr:MAG: hypothetical protein A3A82_03980 [Candidatus Pacebacteria bacterium RIFCSPLOWO2_01_FULL_47_12]